MCAVHRQTVLHRQQTVTILSLGGGLCRILTSVIAWAHLGDERHIRWFGGMSNHWRPERISSDVFHVTFPALVLGEYGTSRLLSRLVPSLRNHWEDEVSIFRSLSAKPIVQMLDDGRNVVVP